MITQNADHAGERFTVSVMTIYALSMAKFIYVQLHGAQGGATPPPIKIKADKIEKPEGEGKYRLSLAGQVVGEINSGMVTGWWMEDTGDTGATF